MVGAEKPGVLATVRYGEAKVWVFRVVRDPESKMNDEFKYNATRVRRECD
jgi:hypothetical protein